MKPEDLLQSDIKLFSMPTIVTELNLMVSTGSSREIGHLIATDAGLTARLLRVANSGFYASTKEITTLDQAVTMVGTRQLVNLVMATVAVNRFAAIRQDLIDMETFWQSSVIMSVAADMLAEAAHSRERGPLFLAGLLHDLGSLILYSKEPQKSQAILVEAEGVRARLPELQRREFGFTYADLGAALARLWKLPEAVELLLRLQLMPLNSDEHSPESRIMRLAGLVTTGLVDGQAVEDVCAAAEQEGQGACPLPAEAIAHVMDNVQERATQLYGSLI